FDIFDWMARVLPGAVITFGIDTLVKLIRALSLGSTAAVAKTAEQAMAIGAFLVAGVVAGALLFAILRVSARPPRLVGVIVGAAVGVAIVLVGRSLDRATTTDQTAGGLWILAASVVWGAALGWMYERLLERGDALATTEAASGDSLERIDRRQFLIRVGGATAAITVVGAVVGSLVGGRREVARAERWSAGAALPNAGASVQPAPGTRPEFTPLDDHYRIDINTFPPALDEKGWRLKVGGLVERPLEMTLDEIRGYRPTHQFVTLACISNEVAGDLISTTRWTGVSLKRLLPDLGLKPNATHLRIRSADGFHEVVALETIQRDERVMLTYAWDGVPLAVKHGFPLRIYIPNIYGMKQPKWIESIEAIERWEEGYWVVRGWDREARMRATSVIDTVAVNAKITDSSGRRLVPIGGIAHAGARGISKVEVRVDDGEWREAQLRAPLSGTTWVVWRYDWPFEDGRHTFAVRCVDGTGSPQISEPSPPHPSGATGLHRKSATL
ncbi:MAG TPA: molybdopterin-dependent oxidoreductase, partial [bacterium]|nr:molybdopterin-dependent oxidoreductase [bacterium]